MAENLYCMTCMFYQFSPQGSGRSGSCHKNPPIVVVVGGSLLTTQFPEVDEKNWCGEHLRKSE